MRIRNSLRLGVSACCLAAILSGCRGKDKVTVVVKPQFEYETIKRVAVIDFKNSTGRPQGKAVSDAIAAKLTAILVQNGTYEVVTRDRLQAVLSEQNLSMTTHVDQSTAVKIGKIAAVDAIITGNVTQCRHDVRNERRTRDKYGLVNGQFTKTGTVPYTWTKRQVDVSASIQLISTSTGRVIWSGDQGGSQWSQSSAMGNPPKMSIGQCQEAAVNRVVNALAGGLVPHVANVKVPKGSIYTCKSFVAGQFMDKTSKFTDKDETVQIVLKLDKNFTDTRLLLRVVYKETDQVVWQQEHTWTGKYGQYGFPVKVAELIQKGGCGKFEAQYYIGGTEIAVEEFRISSTQR